MVEYKVKLEGSDGKSYVISFAGLWKQLKAVMTYDEKQGWNGVTRATRQDLNKLRDLVLLEVLIPKAKEEMLTFLKDNLDVQTRSFYHTAWEFGDRLIAWYKAKQELEAEGRIVSESHGRGQNRTWKLKEVKDA